MISSFYKLVVWSGLFTKVSVYDRVVGDQVACFAGVERGRGLGRKGKRGGLGRDCKAPLFPSFVLLSLPLPFLRLLRRQEIKLLVERDRVKIP